MKEGMGEGEGWKGWRGRLAFWGGSCWINMNLHINLRSDFGVNIKYVLAKLSPSFYLHISSTPFVHPSI